VLHSSEAALSTFEAARGDLAFNCQSALRPRIFRGHRATKTRQIHNPVVSRFSPSLRALTTFNATRRVGSWIKTNLRWGKYPIAPTSFSCLSPAMREQRFLHSQRSAAGQPPAPATSLNRTRIEIHWGEAEAKTIKIRHHYIEAAARVCCINPAGAGPGCWQGHDAQLALDAQARMIFDSRPERQTT